MAVKTFGSNMLKELAICLIFICFPMRILADDAAINSPFFPTWKLLNSAEKQQFVAGYIQGWKDASMVTEITINYVRENPDKAVEGLQKVKNLYNMGDLKPALMVTAIDAFFSDPMNQGAGLSQAVSAAKVALSGR